MNGTESFITFPPNKAVGRLRNYAQENITINIMNEIKSMAELGESYKRHIAEMDRLCRIDGRRIVFQIAEAGDYEIDLSRCDTYEKIVWWAFGLSEKTWMTLPVLRHFIRIACSHHGLQERGPC